jgi:protein TonB
MKLPIAVLLLILVAAAPAAESPPPDFPVTLPRFAFKPRVEDYYPAASRGLKEQGTTKLRFCYDERGRPDEVTVDESSGFVRLDEAAVRWGKAVRITPGVFGKQPQPGCVKLPVKFSLEKSQEPPEQSDGPLPPLEPPRILINPLPPRPPLQPIPLAPSPIRSIPL